jgi:hypothetical protein
MIVHEPLADWAALETWAPPDPLRQGMYGPRDWDQVARDLAAARARGDLASGVGLAHGAMYLRLTYLRGFENLMLDLATGEPRLERLIAVVRDYNVAVIGKYLALGIEFARYGDDLGLQAALPVSPATWRRVFKPCFEAMFGPCRERGIPVYFHSDGHILEIIPDLIDVGVRVINPQIRANGLAGLQAVARGAVAIDIDLDRQLFPFATPAQIADHVAEVIQELALPEGGLMVRAACQPDVPLENIDALCQAVQAVCDPPPPDQARF